MVGRRHLRIVSGIHLAAPDSKMDVTTTFNPYLKVCQGKVWAVRVAQPHNSVETPIRLAWMPKLLKGGVNMEITWEYEQETASSEDFSHRSRGLIMQASHNKGEEKRFAFPCLQSFKGRVVTQFDGSWRLPWRKPCVEQHVNYIQRLFCFRIRMTINTL